MPKESVVCIGMHLKSLQDMSFSKEVISINAHFNDIETLDGLQSCFLLENLNVSSNKLQSLKGLESTSAINSLNVASNQLSSVSGLHHLNKLRYINLSYNNISSIAGFCDLHGSRYSVERIELHGNALRDTGHVVSCLQGLVNLKHLTLQVGIHGNPLCKILGYRQTLIQSLPQLLHLDTLEITQSCSNTEQMFANIVLDLPEDDKTLSVTRLPDACSYISTAQQTNQLTTSANRNPELEDNKLNRKQSTHREDPKPKMKKSVILKKQKIPVMSKLTPTSRKHVIQRKESTSTTDKNTFLKLVKDLGIERERRWKAEQASKRLIAIIQKKHSDCSNEKMLQNLASNATTKLKGALLEEKELTEKFALSLKSIEEENAKIKLDFDQHKEALFKSGELNEHLKSKLDNLALEKKKLKELATDKVKSLNDKLTVLSSTYNDSKLECRTLIKKVRDLEELLITKKEEAVKCSSELLNERKNVSALLAEKVQEAQAKHHYQLSAAEERLSVAQNKYNDLEREFRDALCIENNRFTELAKNHQNLTHMTHDLNEQLQKCSINEEKSKKLITDMTSIIKEQRSKISVLTKDNDKYKIQYKEKISVVETATSDAHKKELQLELIKQENSKLISEITGLKSVIGGLKEERKLWGLELAQQGSSLAQDRGRLELKIENLQTEIVTLKKSNQTDNDVLKIKSKIVNDQTDTIQKLKEALSAKDQEISNKLDENLLEQNCLQRKIEDLEQENSALQNDCAKLQNKKHQLQQKLVEASESYDAMVDEHNDLKTNWSQKIKLLSTLEMQVKSVNEKMTEKEKKLTEEKDLALATASNALKKVDECDKMYKDQLQSLTTAYNNEIKCYKSDKEQEIKRLKAKIKSTEEEMREILNDKEIQEKKFEANLQKIKQTFQNFEV